MARDHQQGGHPAPLQDVLRAIRLVRSRAAQFGVAPTRIGVMGSSTGGHFAASASTLWVSVLASHVDPLSRA